MNAGGHENGLLFFLLKRCFYKVIAIEVKKKPKGK